ncbi:MAG: Mur ligase family protein, partial [Oscillospiraceae bacterium]
MAYLTSIARPDIAIITNIGTMHIEHLGSREGILQAKLEIFRGVPKNGVGVFNGDEPLLWNVRADGGHKKYYFGIENHACDVFATDIQELEDGMRFVVSGFGHRFELFVPVLGRHTVYNALAAVTAALLLKIPPETIQAQISGFQNTGMRQKIYERDGFTIIEDCYNAGPESTEA